MSLAALTLVMPVLSRAQDASSQGAGSSGAVPVATSGAVGGVLGSIGTSDSSGAVTTPTAPPLQQLGRGSWLGPSLSPLHWGSLYIGSAQFLQGYDAIRFSGAGNDILRTSVIGTNVVYDTAIRGDHLAFQWDPQIVFVNGRFLNSLNNENLSLGYATAVSPRLTITVRDALAYVPVNNIYQVNIFSPTEAAVLQSVQNPFLQGPGSWLTNTASVSVAYQLSERTSLIATPTYVYTNTFNSNPASFGSKQYLGSVSLNHNLSETKTIGFSYSENVVKFDSASSPSLPYASFGPTFVDQFSPTWFMNASVAATFSTYGGPQTVWSASGYINVQKSFQTSVITLDYSRGLSLNQYTSHYLTQRADLSYSIRLTRRVSAGAGAGYQSVSGPPRFSGAYASAKAGYQLLPSVGISANYLYGNQTGDNIQIYSEKQNSVFLSLSWAPPRLIQ